MSEESTADVTMHLDTITRVEVIDSDGRAFNMNGIAGGVVIRLQDDRQTLKIFTSEEV